MTGLQRVRVSSLAGIDCSRRIVLRLLKSRSRLEDGIGFSGYLLAGNILHRILQKTFGRENRIDLIEYNHFRGGLELDDAILSEMARCFEDWTSLVTSERFPYASYPDDISLALKRVEEQLPFLARLSETLAYVDKNGVHSRSFADEFIVQTIISDFLLVGHIDLVAAEKDSFRLIELKTGRNKTTDKVQLQLYGDIVHQASPGLDLSLELWYTKSGDRVEVETSDGQILRTIRDYVNNLTSYEDEADLPDPNKRAEDCYFCDLCDQSRLILREL